MTTNFTWCVKALIPIVCALTTSSKALRKCYFMHKQQNPRDVHFRIPFLNQSSEKSHYLSAPVGQNGHTNAPPSLPHALQSRQSQRTHDTFAYIREHAQTLNSMQDVCKRSDPSSMFRSRKTVNRSSAKRLDSIGGLSCVCLPSSPSSHAAVDQPARARWFL